MRAGRRRFAGVLLLLCGLPAVVLAQRVRTVRGEYTYVVPANVAVETARQTALQRARLDALVGAFGMLVSQTNATLVSSAEGRSAVDFTSLASSDVKGEWLEDARAPEYDETMTDGVLVVTCRVEGRAREVLRGHCDLQVMTLRNGEEEKFAATDFRDGDDFYLSFSAPVAGHLAVYLVADGTAFRLLPYAGTADASVAVAPDRRYVFFSERYADKAGGDAAVTPLYLFTDRVEETDFLYVIFSPHVFVRPVDSAAPADGEQVLPQQLVFADFQRWLTRNRLRDDRMQVELRALTIRK